jgi:hypothetical protein
VLPPQKRSKAHSRNHASRRSEHGSVAIEAAVALSALATLISGGLALSYFLFAKIWLQHSAYEASICLSTPAFESSCESKMKDSVGAALPIGELNYAQLGRNQLETSVSLTWKIADGIEIHIEDHRTLPLMREQI